MAENTAKVTPTEVAAPPPPPPPAAAAAAAPGGSGGGNYQMQNVIINQVVSQPKIGQRQDERPWSSGICGCFEDCNSLCYAYFCYPYFLCSLANSMDEFCLGPCCFFTGGSGCGATVFPNPFLVGMRSRLRGQYGIKGSVCNDVMCIWCCECCATMQMSRELKHWSKQ